MNPNLIALTDSILEPRYWMVVPAAGIGRRFSLHKAKQFYDLCGETVAQRCLHRLLQVPGIVRLIVPCDLQQSAWGTLSVTNDPRVQLVSGGATRADSVVNGLRAIADCAEAMDWVLVHDIARPCVALESIAKLRRAVEHHPVGGILTAPIADSLKRVTAAGNIEHTLDRADYRLAQTPQMFRYGELTAALEAILALSVVPADEAEALERVLRPVMVVEGRQDNIKITCREDLAVAAAIFTQQENA